MEEMIRVYKLDLEQRIGVRIEVNWIIFEWLVEYAADVINKFVVGRDGRTAYERVKGRKHHGEFARFCSYVMYRVAGSVQGGVMTERWMPGLWLGKRFHTDEHIVMNFGSGKIYRTRNIRVLEHDIGKEDVLRCVGHPWLPSGVAKVSDEIPKAIENTSEVPEEFTFTPKEFQIRLERLQKYGFTDGCPKCRVLMAGRPAPGNNHSVACRKRIADKMKEDPREAKMVKDAEVRNNKYLDSEIARLKIFVVVVVW